MIPDRLAQAQVALKLGDIEFARKLVAQTLIADPSNEQAWLFMARLVNDRDQVIDCLEHAIKINPTNLTTRQALKAISRGRITHAEPLTQSTTLTSTQAARLVAEKPRPELSKEAVPLQVFTLPVSGEEAIHPPKQKFNGSLVFGILIVFIVVLIATIGPKLAPQDPAEEHAILQVGNTWVIPPFNAFQVPGYILGSDQFGRDMLSRILYAVRPTLIMVSIVAIVRLFLGTLIGLGAGWFNGRKRRFLDGLISAALAVPIILVALGAITMLGVETGLIAFIVGLSINGWGETARFVREQTLLIKQQLFIESARSLGASTFQILVQHILRQIMPLVWMLFAFEISGTLMVTAGLGFLGYYIGGDVWIAVGDFVSRRVSGAPELGQMLATSWVNLLQPWPLVLTGSVIFLTVLGFNLLGNGLRDRVNPEYVNRANPINVLSQRVKLWFEESVSYPVSTWFKANPLRPVYVFLGVFALAGSVFVYQKMFSSRFNPSQATLTVPGGQIWASDKVDPYGTYYVNFLGPSNPDELWVIEHPAGFSGNPVIAADGTIYAAGLDGVLMAVNPDGSTRWQSSLPETPMGPLTLGPQGDIYVTDENGGLSAFSAEGNILWTYSSDADGRPNHGAIVAPDGTIYYLQETGLGDTLNALTPDGQLLWSVKPGSRGANTGLRLTPDGKQLFMAETVVNTVDGSPVDITFPTEGSRFYANQAHLLIGADSKTYLLAGHIVMQWTETSQGFNLVETVNWAYRNAGMSQYSSLPPEAGVSPQGDIWLYYTNVYEGTFIYWLNLSGKILDNFSYPFNRVTHFIAIDGARTAYACGLGLDSTNEMFGTICQANPMEGSEPLWYYLFPEGTFGVTGAALAPGRLYVLTAEGNLTALGDSSSVPQAPSTTP